MSPEENAWLTGFALPLFLVWRETARTDPHMRALGTGWLLEFGEDLLLVSAAHVLKEVQAVKDKPQIDDLFVVRGPLPNESPVAVSGSMYLAPDREDVGFIRLNSDVVDALREFPRVVMNDLSIRAETETEFRAVVGWPQELRPATATRLEDGTKLYTGTAFAAAGETYCAVEVGPNGSDFLYMPFDLLREGSASAPNSLRGISGAPIWARRGDEWRVIGIETDVVQKGHLRFIQGTPILALVELIARVTRPAGEDG